MQVTVGKSLFKQVDLMGQKLESAVMEKASDIVTDAVGLSPVHTGAFVESWQINPRGERSRRARSSAGRTPLPEGAKEAKRETEKTRLLSRVASFDFSTLDGFTVTNTAPHKKLIEENPRVYTGLKPSEIQAYLRNKHG